jgi:hypothetical protein
MKLKITPSIPELLRQLPEGTITYIDLRCLSALNDCVKALRTEHEGQEAPNLFTQDVRASLAAEINDALAQIIKARIPKNARGTVNKRVGLEKEWEEKRAAKAALKDKREDLQAVKRCVLEMREALEKFERICIDTAGFEPVGMPPDASRRHARLDPYLPILKNALDTLDDAPFPNTYIEEQVTAMYTLYDELQLSVNRWCAVNAPSVGKAAGVHKGKALADWLEACKRLGRDVAECLRNLK